MKICIITHPLHNNYGGLLQAYALQKVLSDMGHEVVTDKDGYWSDALKYSCKYKLYQSIALIIFKLHLNRLFKIPSYTINSIIKDLVWCKKFKEYINTNKKFIADNIKTIKLINHRSNPSLKELSRFNAIIVGSDQVWRSIYVKPQIYFLGFDKPKNIIQIAYAASFGVDNIDEYTHKEKEDAKQLIRNFDAVSVREDSGILICNKELGSEARLTLDPTLLLEKEEYLNLVRNIIPNKNIGHCYILDKNKEKDAIIDILSKKLNIKFKNSHPYSNTSNNEQNASHCTIYNWIANFRDSKFVITDSYHGTVFSLIFNIPFISIVNKNRGTTRFHSLLKLVGLEDRLIYNKSDLDQIEIENVNFREANFRLNRLRKESIDFLTENLKKK